MQVHRLAERILHVTFSNRECIGAGAFTIAIEKYGDRPESFMWAEVTKFTIQVDSTLEEKAEFGKSDFS
jgi:hypothetical protein